MRSFSSFKGVLVVVFMCICVCIAEHQKTIQ